ncbi:aminopeptidase [bacterium]|nr:aminopeptidase [bacterium]
MTTETLRKWADLLVDYCVQIKPGETVLIASETTAEPLARLTAEAAIKRGALPIIRLEIPGMTEYLIRHGSLDQIRHVHVSTYADASSADARIRILAESQVKTETDPEKKAIYEKAREPLRHLMAGRRWALTQFPTETYAQLAGMSMQDYESFVTSAMYLDRDDPVAAWQELGRRQAKVIERVKVASKIRLVAEGTDLTLDVTGRTWINSDGRRNMPSGEVFTGPHENSAQGRLHCARPVLRDGVRLEGITLTFEKGKVVEAAATVGQDYLRAMIAMDEGASFVGELGLGLNDGIDRFSGSILFDEKIGGTAHVALGSSYPETGGTNRSALHWDFIIDLRDGGKILADDSVVCENGLWRID